MNATLTDKQLAEIQRKADELLRDWEPGKPIPGGSYLTRREKKDPGKLTDEERQAGL